MPHFQKTSSSAPNSSSQVFLRTFLVAIASVFINTVTASEDIYAVQSRISTPNFQLFLQIDDDSTAGASGALFGPLGGVYAATFMNDVFYGVELSNGTFIDYLVTIPHKDALVGQGSRVTGTPIGFPNIEGLANVNGTLIASSVNFAGHHTEFISINPVTGVGTSIGTGSTDVMIFGLAYDPIAGVLYGAGKPNATVSGHNLYSINPATGATTFVGSLGTKIEGLTFSKTIGLIGIFDHLYSIDPATGAATRIGSTDYIDGKPGTLNGCYAVAAIPPEGLPAPFKITSITNAAGEFTVTWPSETGFSYQLRFTSDLSGAWGDAGAAQSGTGSQLSVTHTPGVAAGFYHVVKTASP